MIFSRPNLGTFTTCVAIQGCGVVTGVLTARTLGPVARGELATVMLWPIIFSNLGLLGCNWALAREVAGNRHNEANYARAAVTVGFASGILSFVIAFAFIPHLLPAGKRQLIPLARLCLFFIPLDILNQFLIAIEQGRMRWTRFNLARISFFLCYLILICAIWAARQTDVIFFVWAFLISHGVAVAFRIYMQRELLFAGKLHLEACLRLLRAGFPYLAAAGTNLATVQLDKILVVSLMSSEAAGIYVVASAFSAALSPFGDALGITSFAILSNETGFERRQKILTQTFRHSSLISIGLGCLLAGAIPFLIQPLFGMNFSAAVRPSMMLALAAALTTSSGILNEGLRGAGRPLAGIASQLVGGAIMALAALVLLRRYELVGIAWAVLLGSCAQVAVLISAAARWLRISPFSFWPFGVSDVREVMQQAAELRLRLLRTPA